ncbi:MAG: hypothetical protein PHD41_00035 [Methanosarcinaceae archaeon]|nr:hypothetical protein [Methanosarcinaceae archaeon]MDD4331507.1 hypothetical protein [Methanosarcinaceae archaeon]MDD4748383.1 hypothetical protein [Methanosarcinaceae archaeon]
MSETKLKNTIVRSFEIQDYRLKDTDLSGFWADLVSKEELTVEVNYRPEQASSFSPEAVKALCLEICQKCDSFQGEVPENIRCEVTFKNFEDTVYAAEHEPFIPKPETLEEIKVMYRFYVAYYL